MVAVHAGTDTYGKVKQVGLTPVVTKFAMLSGVPIYPLESLYFAGEGTPEGVPFIYTSTAIYGLPLARLDLLSVIMAYARGVFGLLTIAGFFGLFVPLVASIGAAQPPRDDFVKAMRVIGSIGLGVGVFGGLLTYVTPFQVTQREKQIRMACGAILGIWADPARIREDEARALLSKTSKLTREQLKALAPTADTPEEFVQLACQLVVVRAKIALSDDRQPLEVQTDLLLHQIDRVMNE